LRGSLRLWGTRADRRRSGQRSRYASTREAPQPSSHPGTAVSPLLARERWPASRRSVSGVAYRAPAGGPGRQNGRHGKAGRHPPTPAAERDRAAETKTERRETSGNSLRTLRKRGPGVPRFRGAGGTPREPGSGRGPAGRQKEAKPTMSTGQQAHRDRGHQRQKPIDIEFRRPVPLATSPSTYNPPPLLIPPLTTPRTDTATRRIPYHPPNPSLPRLFLLAYFLLLRTSPPGNPSTYLNPFGLARRGRVFAGADWVAVRALCAARRGPPAGSSQGRYGNERCEQSSFGVDLSPGGPRAGDDLGRLGRALQGLAPPMLERTSSVEARPFGKHLQGRRRARRGG